MKWTVSCQYKQAIKAIQREKKYFKIYLLSSKVRKMCWQTRRFNTSENGRQQRKSFYPLVVVKTKKNSAFLLWRQREDTNAAFQLKLANFLVPIPHFMFKWQINWNVEYGYTWKPEKKRKEKKHSWVSYCDL